MLNLQDGIVISYNRCLKLQDGIVTFCNGALNVLDGIVIIYNAKKYVFNPNAGLVGGEECFWRFVEEFCVIINFKIFRFQEK